MELSNRLETIASFVTEGYVVATSGQIMDTYQSI